MSSALSSPFLADSIAEVVPDVAKVAGKLAQSSVITGRRRVRLVPQSGQNYDSGNSAGVINILIQDGSAYADLLSAVISFELTTGNTGGSAATQIVVPDDGAYSVFRRALISVNSTLMDDIDFLPKKVNAELYATASQDWYNNVGSWLGLWKYNTSEYGYQDVPSAGGGAAPVPALISKYNTLSKIPLFGAKVCTTGPAGVIGPNTPGLNKFAVPLSLLTSFFRNDTLFPSRNAGQLYVQLNLASAIEALIVATAGTPASLAGVASAVPSFSIRNLTMELDYCDLHPTYLSMMDDLIESPGGVGVQWAFDAHMVATQNLAGSGGNAGQQSVVVSKASQNMRSLQVIVQPSAGLSSTSFFGQSCFNNPGFKDIQYRIGSLYFPAFTAIGEHRAYFDLQNAFGSPESVDRSGLVDNLNYYLATDVATPNAVVLNDSGDDWTAGSVNNNALTASCSGMWMYAYCFDRLKHAKIHGVDLDGINTLTSAGSQMVVQLNCNPVGGLAQTMSSIVRFTRVLVLRNGATQVVG